MCVPEVVFKLKFENNNYKVSKNEAMPEKNLAVSMFVKVMVDALAIQFG